MNEQHHSLVCLGKWHSEGFDVFESYGDHTLHLYFKGKEIGTFNQSQATSEVLMAKCQDFYNKLTAVGGVGSE
jgi:hypothetical protein